ncbi:chaperone protein HscA [Tamaricihabitans halophyticus]|uniref:Chaperone protein HscA n=1 Tax=Tamaricihabitans halophyticus TaxID=1262583 RepID=A0A4R2QTG2_9PSEU|nr:type VII secretion-associated protein [Tamaricihabitans halophyticus]TCP53243.1 chaperone protein HscA [Tamaricihabitans halophyticus]
MRVAVDFGTSSTCVAVSVRGQEPQAVVIDGAPLMSSAVYAAPDGTLFVGQEAERQAAVDPSRYEPNPKRRIDEGELLLGDTVLQVTEVVRAVLRRAVDEARRVANNAEVDVLVLTHPADWGAIRGRVLRQAANGLGREITLVPEPVAAAVFHAATFAPADGNEHRTVEVSAQPGETLAVLDLGGGTVDVSVVRRTDPRQDPAHARRGGFQVLATRGDPSFGGADIDQALLEHVGGTVAEADTAAWRELVEGRELPDRRRRRVLRQDVRGAKETLSRHAYTDVPMPPPFADAHVTRVDLEELITEPLSRAAELTVAAIDEAGLRPKQLTAIFLVGGSSRIPMIARLLHARTGVMPTTLDQPETVVARGALRATTAEPDQTGGAPAGAQAPRHPTSGPRPVPPAVAATQQVGGPTQQVGAGPTQQVGQGRQTNQAQPPPNRPGAPGQPQAHPGQPRQAQPTGPRPHGGYPAPGRSPYSQPGQAGVYAADQPTQRTSPVGSQEKVAGKGKARSKLPWLVGGAVVLVVAAVAGLVVWLVGGSDDTQPGQQTAAPELAEFQFRFNYPESWRKTGSDAELRKVELRPAEPQSDVDALVVQEFQLNYDVSDARAEIVEELRGKVEQSEENFQNFDGQARYVNRDVVYYQQLLDGGGTVDWYVFFNGRTQVSVGCQYDDGREKAVRPACDKVASTLRIGNQSR